MLTMNKNHYKERYESKTETLKRLVESQKKTIDILERSLTSKQQIIQTLELQLNNERYRHNQTRNSPKGNGTTSIED